MSELNSVALHSSNVQQNLDNENSKAESESKAPNLENAREMLNQKLAGSISLIVNLPKLLVGVFRNVELSYSACLESSNHFVHLINL